MFDVFSIICSIRNAYWKALSCTLFPKIFWKFGKGSILIRPIQVRGAKYISVGKKVIINPFTWLFAMNINEGNTPILSIGDNVYIGHFAHISAVSNVKIDCNVLIADKVYISDHNHRIGWDVDVRHSGTVTKGSVKIGKNVWIGEGACILTGVTIGEGSVIGANAVVTQSIPRNCIAGGIPAKVIKRIEKINS